MDLLEQISENKLGIGDTVDFDGVTHRLTVVEQIYSDHFYNGTILYAVMKHVETLYPELDKLLSEENFTHLKYDARSALVCFRYTIEPVFVTKSLDDLISAEIKYIHMFRVNPNYAASSYVESKVGDQIKALNNELFITNEKMSAKSVAKIITQWFIDGDLSTVEIERVLFNPNLNIRTKNAILKDVSTRLTRYINNSPDKNDPDYQKYIQTAIEALNLSTKIAIETSLQTLEFLEPHSLGATGNEKIIPASLVITLTNLYVEWGKALLNSQTHQTDKFGRKIIPYQNSIEARFFGVDNEKPILGKYIITVLTANIEGLDSSVINQYLEQYNDLITRFRNDYLEIRKQIDDGKTTPGKTTGAHAGNRDEQIRGMGGKGQRKRASNPWSNMREGGDEM